jgi:hypothetical protein
LERTRGKQRLPAPLDKALDIYSRMLEAIAESIGRFLLWLFAVVLGEKVFYPIGWMMLKLLTLGFYPPPCLSQRKRELVAIFPVVCALIWITVAYS